MKEILQPIFSLLPQVRSPTYRVPFKEKLKWTGVILILYFILSQVALFGLSATAVDQFASLRAVLAGSFGSIITLGIGPIVSASIILQLLVGGKIINLDLSKPEDKAFFQGTQKLLAIIFTLFEAAVLVLTGALPASSPDLLWILILQITIGGILIIFLDEVVSKWGFGSGVGLFIAAGVSQCNNRWSIKPTVKSNITRCACRCHTRIYILPNNWTTRLLPAVTSNRHHSGFPCSGLCRKYAC